MSILYNYFIIQKALTQGEAKKILISQTKLKIFIDIYPWVCYNKIMKSLKFKFVVVKKG